MHDFQRVKPGTKEYLLCLIELLARSCHEIATRLFNLEDVIHKRDVYEAWRDANVDLQTNPGGTCRPPAVFFHPWYAAYKQYPAGIADVVGYWAEARIFGGVVVFDRGPSGVEVSSLTLSVEDHATDAMGLTSFTNAYMLVGLSWQRREVYIHGGHHKAPLTLFPPTSQQLESLGQYLLQPGGGPCPLPIHSSLLNGYRYHPHDAMSRYNIFRDRYERNEPQTRSDHRRFMDGRNWPEVQYLFKWMELQETKAQGIEIDEEELAAVEEGMRRITPSSPHWVEADATDQKSLDHL